MSTLAIVPPKAEYDRRNEAEFRDQVTRTLTQGYDRRSDLTVPFGKTLGFTSAQGQVITFGYNESGQFTVKQDANSPFGLASISYVSSVQTSLEGQIAVLEVDVEAANDAAEAAASSAMSAQTSATNAGNSATAAQTSATNASTSASNAATSATNASNSASNASTSASQASTSASNAAGSASAANISATAAAASEFAAAGSATAASGSASNASSSATQAATSASNAAGSASNASTSATNAANSATSAGNSATAASTSASQASTSATNAGASEAAASTSANNAANSATSAGNSATAASGSASNAATSATNAGNSATSAQNSATSAATQASNAATSAGQASTSAGNASTSASQASTSASNAAGSASSASTSATNAANSATSAGNSATAASTSASNASTSATNAGVSASAAQTSATNAAGSASNAASSASTATTQASNASASAASAAASSTLSATFASGSQGSINSSATFADNANATGIPTNWGDWSWGWADATRVTGIAPQPYAWRIVATAGRDTGILQNLLGRVTTGWHVIEADITLNSGVLSSAGIHVNWDGGSSNIVFSTDPDINGAVIGAGTTGKLYKFRKLVQVTAGTTYQNIYAMSIWGGYGSLSNANDITWHRVALRAASQAEIEARQAKEDLVTANATISSQGSTIASHTASLASQATTISANFNTLAGGLGFGGNSCPDSEFIDDAVVWNNRYTQSGSVGAGGAFFYQGRRYLYRIPTGMTVGHQANLGVGADYAIAVEPGERLEFSVVVSPVNVSKVQIAIDWYDAAGTYVFTSIVKDNVTSLGRHGGFVTVPAGAAKAAPNTLAIAASSSPDWNITQPVLRKCSPTQTTLSPYTPTESPNTHARIANAQATANSATSAITNEAGARASADTSLSASFASNIGTSSQNLLLNTDWTNSSLAGWEPGWDGTVGGTVIRDFATGDWTGTVKTRYVYRVGTPAAGLVVDSDITARSSLALLQRWAVKLGGGERLWFGAYLGTHRCNGAVAIAYYDGGGTYITETRTEYIPENGGFYTGNPANAARVGAFHTAPSNARFLVFWARMETTGQTDPFLFWGWPMVAIASAVQTAVPKYVSGGQDRQLSGDMVAANAAISANQTAIANETSARASADTTLSAQINVNSNRFPHPQPLSTDSPSTYGWQGDGITVGQWEPLGGLFYYKARGSGGAAVTEFYYFDLESSAVAWVSTGEQYTLSAVGYGGAGTSGDRLTMWLEFFNSSNTLVYSSPVVTLGSYAPTNRYSSTSAYTSGGEYVRRRVVFKREWAASGSYQDVVFNRIKLERGSVATAYTNEGAANTLQASVTTNASAIATVDGKLTASYGVTVDANGRIASMKLLSNGTTSSVKFTADTFQIFNGSTDVAPFEVTGGNVKIKSANVGTLNIGSGGITIQSGSSGARIVISNSLVEVYDSTRLRVRMGIW